MTRKSEKISFIKGIKDGFPFVLVIGPFAMLFGVVATEAGLNLAQTMVMTVFVIAGAAQFAAVQQMVDNVPILMVLATSLAVNMRMAMYSATMVPHFGSAPIWKRAVVAYLLVDQSAVMGAEAFEKQPDRTMSEKFRYILGMMVPIAGFWYAGTLFGALVGGQIPDSFALDFAMPITFLAMIAPMVKTLAHLAAAATSVIVALALSFLPYGSGLLIASVCAMTVGALVEIAQTRKAAA